MDKDVLREGVFFALQEPANVADPYPLYHRLRSCSPFHWDFLLSGWFLTRYTDVAAALADPRLSTENFTFDITQLPRELQVELEPLGRLRKREALYNNAPEHDRLRRPLNRAFNPSVFERLRPGVELLADQLLAKAEKRSVTDLVSEYTQPLGNFMMCELLAIPNESRKRFVSWFDDLRDFVTAPRIGAQTLSKARVAAKSLTALQNFSRKMIAERRESFADDVIGQSLAVEPKETPPTEDEIIANCILFLHAGMRNMAASLANALVALLKHPKEFAEVRASPQLLAVAIEELLRYDTPLHVAIRGVREEMELGGHRLLPKQLLVLLLGAANRDPAQFAQPDRLDLGRRPNRHVSFGVGPHGCIGAWLARFGLSIALSAIIRRDVRLELTRKKLQWNLPAMRRTPLTLPVLVERAKGLGPRARRRQLGLAPRQP